MLTDAQVKAAQPRAVVYELDADDHGLKLRVLPSGVKVWSMRYRTSSGDRRRVTIGQYPDVKLSKARDKAAELRDRIRAGADPNDEKAAEREALRMVDLFGETGPLVADRMPKTDKVSGWYLQTYVRTAGRLGTVKSAKGIANDRSYIHAHIRSRKALMRKAVADVTKADLEKIKAEVTPSTWRKVRNILLVGFRHAEELGVVARGSNPAEKTKASTDAKRERFLSPAERQRLDEVLTKAEKLGPDHPGGLSRHLVRALRLLELTGCRRSEVLSLHWQHVDWRHSVLRLPTSKTGARVVPLTPQAVAYLKQEKGSTARMGLVCCTEDGGAIHPENIGRAWRRIRAVAGLDKVRLHDLRHSWASDAVSAGVPLYVVGKALGHSQPSTTARYSHLHDEAVREGLATAGDAIERARKGDR